MFSATLQLRKQVFYFLCPHINCPTPKQTAEHIKQHANEKQVCISGSHALWKFSEQRTSSKIPVYQCLQINATTKHQELGQQPGTLAQPPHAVLPSSISATSVHLQMQSSFIQVQINTSRLLRFQLVVQMHPTERLHVLLSFHAGALPAVRDPTPPLCVRGCSPTCSRLHLAHAQHPHLCIAPSLPKPQITGCHSDKVIGRRALFARQ